jgi:peptide/nickel transport system substrate-binding protein
MTQNSQESSDSGLANLLNFEASRRQALAIGGMSLGALLLAACSGGSSGNTSPTQPAGKPKKGGTLRASISDGSDGDTLDPGLVVSTNSFLACYPIYDQLAVLDDNFQAQPALAKSWTVNADATRWTIHLREGVKWHDGTDFTSKDVVYTISRWLDPKTGSQFNAAAAPYLDMSGVKAPDASTVVLNLKKPNSILIQSVANAPYTMIIKDGVKDFTKNAIGTGPFKLAAWTPGASWKVVRNDAHWGGAPYLDGIAATVTPDQGAKLQAALSGSTDVTDLIPTSLWRGLQGRNNVVLDTMKNRNCWVFAFDERKAPFNDQRVLDAFKLATDRNKIVQTAVLGHGTAIADVPIDPTS